MKNRLIALLLTIALLSSVLAIFPVKALPCNIKVEPPSVTFWSGTDPPGTPFTVSIIIENIPDPGFYGWEFWLYWDAGDINCTGEVINTVWPANSGPLVATPIDNAAGTYHQGVAARSPSTPLTGTFWLANLTFIIVRPAPYMGSVHTDLTIGPPEGMTYCIVDQSATEISHTFTHGEYTYIWSPPTINPRLEVEYTGFPGVHDKTFSGKNIYKTPFTFQIDVVIKNVAAGWQLAGMELLLFYNTSVLDVLTIDPGTFLDPFTSPGGTWFYSLDFPAEGKIRIAYAIVDIPSMTPPYGEGLVARITFNATYQEKFPTSVYSDLDVEIDYEAGMTSYFVNYLGDELPYDPEVDGSYTLMGYVVGRVIDLFTQYTDPYGGQGPTMPSDMFWPQKEVHLYANVTYNDWPVQNKDVAFQVLNKDGGTMTILTGRTNDVGIAHVSFRMDWPCVNPEDLFGVWTVIATVDIACIVVNDTLQFHYDYLVHLTTVTVDKDPAEYAHCETVIITVNFTSYAMQEYWVAIYATLHDELNYPAISGTVGEWVLIGGAVWCQAKPYTVTFRIHVDKAVVAGEATIHVSAMTCAPLWGGCALCPEATTKISILPTWV